MMTLKAAKQTMDMQYRVAKSKVVENGFDALEQWGKLMDRMEGVTDACIYGGKEDMWKNANKYRWTLYHRFWNEVVESRC